MHFSLVLSKNTVYIICILTINNNMTKNDIKSLLFAAAIVLFGYGLMFGFYYFADYIGIYESLRY